MGGKRDGCVGAGWRVGADKTNRMETARISLTM